MKIIKLFLSIIFITSFAYADNPWDYVEELTTELETSTELIQELKEENIKLKESNTDLEEQLKETTKELENSTRVIVFMRNQLMRSDEELVFFREEYEQQLIISTERKRFLGLGLGVSYPTGGEVIVSITIPFFQSISIYGRFGLQTSINIMHAGAGVIINF